MTKRKNPPPPIDPDDFGFDVFGKGFRVSPREVKQLAGQDALAVDLYYRCLKPFADRAGAVRNASYYRFLKILKPVQSPGGGPRLRDPTRRQLEVRLARLADARLITNYTEANRHDGALQIRLQNAPGSTSKF